MTHASVADQTRPRGTPFWLWLNLLSLDAPLVAVVWQDFLARHYSAALQPAGRWALLLTVWAIYIADRLMDVRRPAAGTETSRHGFYRRNRVFACGLLAVVLAADAVVAVWGLRLAVLLSGLLPGALVVGYLAVFPFWRIGRSRWKQPCAALLFTAGVFLMEWIGMPDAVHVLLLPALTFFSLCLGNMRLIEGSARGWIGMAALALCCLAGFGSPWYTAVTVAAVGLAALDFFGDRLSPDARGVAADLVLLIPLLMR